MKQLEFKASDFEELSVNEAIAIDGGFAWVPFLIFVAAGLLIACPTAAQDDEVYPGGELEPAICEG